MRSCFVPLFAAAAACSSGAKAPLPTAPVPAAPTPAAPAAPPAAPAPAAPGTTDRMSWAAPTMSLAQSGVVPAWLDKSADPCTDFYAHACGGFLRTAQIPADRSRWGAIEMVEKDNEDFLRGVLERAVAAPSTDPVAQKLGAYHAACMDEAAIEAAGIAPIQPELAEVAKVKDAKTAAAAVIALHAAGLSPFFGLGQQQDYADATQVIAGLDQAGLGLPDRKYYLENTGTLPTVRKAYQAHVARMFTLLGDPRAKAAAQSAYELEVQLARAQQDEVVRRDPHAVYHRVDRDGLTKKVAPSFPWADYFTALGIPSVTAISVNDPAYFTTVAKLLATTKPQQVRDYLTWTILRARADLLGKAWVDEKFAMRKVMSGQQELEPRWRRCVERADADLGELLAQAYVAARFGGDSKPRARDLATAIVTAMGLELDSLPWMDTATRAAAKAKLAKITSLIGYPDKWRAYEFAVSPKTYAANALAAEQWEQARELRKIGKPVDRFDWAMTPPTVNAYYDNSLDQFVLPAGQLQAPFFGRTFHPAVNFGSTGGGTIGHELTHGFDDEGSQFDGDGNLRDWWSKDTKGKFAAATKCIEDQYASYEAVPGVHLNGKLTAGENIADNGGVKIAYEAYKAWRAAQTPRPTADIDGYTDDQLYYLAYGQSWCEKLTPEALEQMAHTTPHSPPRWRVNGVVVNQPGFAAAFKCTAGAPMNPGKSCSVW